MIGSGPGGSTAASFLCKAGIPVTLLEAGPRRGSFGLTVRIRGMTVANVRQPLRGYMNGANSNGSAVLDYAEELSPGGLSNHWSCGVPRFSPEDFADARRGGEVHTWPIEYEDLAPYYERVEPLLHIAGASEDSPHLPAGKVRYARSLHKSWAAVEREAAREDRTVLPMPYAYRDDTTLTWSGTVFNAFVRLVQPALRSGTLEVRYDARALHLEWSRQKGRVTAVVYRDLLTGRDERVSCRAVVVAAGAINTAQLLLSSTSDEFPEGLGNTHGVLGRYLHDHPVGKLVVDLASPISMSPSVYITRAGLERTPPLYAAACMQWGGANMYVKSVLGRSPGRLPWAGFSVFGTMEPTREDAVRLVPDASRNWDGSCPVTVSIQHPKAALDVLNQTREETVELMRRAGTNATERVWKVEHAGESYHWGGTARMHASPEYGMVDAWSRLHAVPNVAVADSSSFTTGPEKNPVLTLMALSARASDRLAQDLKSGAI